MIRTSYGDLLKRFRTEKQIKASELCGGLCSTPMMSRYEQDERHLDVLMLEMLLSRMGVSSGYFSAMVTEPEYEYLQWRSRVADAIGNCEGAVIEELLQQRDAEEYICNEKIEKQFHLMAKGVALGLKEEYKEAAQLMLEAISQTYTDIEHLQDSKTRLSERELYILILYLYYGALGGFLKRKEQTDIFKQLEAYIRSEKISAVQQARLYAKVVCVGVSVLGNKLTESRKLSLCKKAIEILRKEKRFDDITELLSMYIPLLKAQGSDELSFYEKQYETFCEIFQEEGMDTTFRAESYVWSRCCYYIINEVLYSKRKEEGLSQEALAEGICEPETYSRIEKAKRAPSRKNMQQLAERLDMKWCYYGGEIDTDLAKAYELRIQARDLRIEAKYEESLNVLKKLENLLDMNNKYNYQYVKQAEYMAMYKLKELSEEEVCKKLEQLLEMTKNLHIESENVGIYSTTELEIITEIGQRYRKMGKVTKAMRLLEKVLKQVSQSKTQLEDQWTGVAYMIRVLGNIYFSNQEYDKCIEAQKYVKCREIRSHAGDSLANILDSIADALEHKGRQHKDEYEKLCRQTYYVADFFHINRLKNTIKRYYEENFDSNIKWY